MTTSGKTLLTGATGHLVANLLRRLLADGDDVRVMLRLSYDTFVAGGHISGILVGRQGVDARSMELCYEYPYQWSNTGDKIKHGCILLPISERQTRVFFMFYFDGLKILFTRMKMPRWLQEKGLQLAKLLVFKPILREYGVALEAEQQGYDPYCDAPPIELNPDVSLFQQLTAHKWQDYLARAGANRPMK